MRPPTNIRELRAALDRRRSRAARARYQAEVAAGALAPIIIYSLPKTAGSTLQATLEVPLVGRQIIHTHRLSDAGIAGLDARVAATPPGERLPIRPHKRASLDVARAALADPDRRPIVITVCRSPLPRAISWFFQSWRRDFPWVGDGRPVTDADVERLLEQFHERLPLSIEISDAWWDDEIGDLLGFDFLAEPLGDADWRRYELDGCDVALVRAEFVDDVFPEVAEAMLGIVPPIVHVNVGEQKEYAAHLRAFRDRLRLSTDEADLVRGCRQARAFYAPADIEATLRPYLGD